MTRRFSIAAEVEPEVLDWGELRWLSHPPSTGAKHLTVIDVNLAPGKAHDFHKHPDQEEVILVIAGTVEQWVDREKRILGPGDSAHIPADVVHASFNVGDTRRQDRRHPRPVRRRDRLRTGRHGRRGAVEVDAGLTTREFALPALPPLSTFTGGKAKTEGNTGRSNRLSQGGMRRG